MAITKTESSNHVDSLLTIFGVSDQRKLEAPNVSFYAKQLTISQVISIYIFISFLIYNGRDETHKIEEIREVWLKSPVKSHNEKNV